MRPHMTCRPLRCSINLALLLVTLCAFAATASNEGLRLATFDVDVTPPVGSMLAYDPVVRVDELTLRCRGIVLIGADQPIVLCAVDWIGIANESQDAFREALAKAARTTPERVAIHTLHQHDAPGCDFTAEGLLKKAGAKDLGRFESTFQRKAISRAAPAVQASIAKAQPLTYCGWGEADVKEVASNRRIPGPDGRIRATRYTACKDPKLRAEPEGVIDPRVSLLSFWNDDAPLAVLSYYACHPQSYYRMGIPSPDFPAIARFFRQQAVPEALHVHFNGAGGNLGAGKYNDGSRENRVALALRLADGMKRAWDATKVFPVSASCVQWRVEPVALPLGKHLDETKLRADMANQKDPKIALNAADHLAWVLRCKSGHRIPIAMLAVGDARVLHMPGELFVEYQLAAKKMRSDLHVAMAAYGDYGPGYIGTARAYEEGGYETSKPASDVSPEVEAVLTNAMRKLLEVK
ncbi:MAG: hypothetical protein NT105_12225 [Verrucomicrobia bacterium]|nr:hypothetical protein [Verrucomicrobiota bacterium]